MMACWLAPLDGAERNRSRAGEPTSEVKGEVKMKGRGKGGRNESTNL